MIVLRMVLQLLAEQRPWPLRDVVRVQRSVRGSFRLWWPSVWCDSRQGQLGAQLLADEVLVVLETAGTTLVDSLWHFTNPNA